MAEDFDNVMNDLIRSYFGEKIKRINILNQNGANLVYTKGIDTARKLGIPDKYIQNITPFPGSTVIVGGSESGSDNTPKDEPTKTSGLSKWGIPAAIVGTVPALAGVLWWFSPDDATPSIAPESPPAVTAPAEPGSVGLRIE